MSNTTYEHLAGKMIKSPKDKYGFTKTSTSDEEEATLSGANCNINHSVNTFPVRSKTNKSNKNRKVSNTVKNRLYKDPLQVDNELKSANKYEKNTPIINSNKERGNKPSFTTEILAMMHAFGDVANPLYQSAILIEEIIRRQISNLLIKTSELTLLRGAKIMTVDDILLQFRKNKKKYKHILKILNFKEAKAKTLKHYMYAEDDINYANITADTSERDSSKIRKYLSEIFSHYDDMYHSFELDRDEIQAERTERLEILTRKMDQSQYLEFSECRQVTFSKRINKFREWLDCISIIDAKPNVQAIELLSVLAYETVGRVIELSLIVKADTEHRSSDCFLLHSNRLCLSTAPSHEFSETSSQLPSTSGITGKRKRSHKDQDSWNFPGEPIYPHHIQEAIRRCDTILGPMCPFTSYPLSAPLNLRTLCS
ncbi:Transcription initiation protein SPT3-like protein [Trichoplax sp. H2]|nr:Transcription initiation protein SPT3-like protein [Trichoplax sp. H2]|eukprot:RDD46790.1 Transcription initiation protein SPT3-like protein [Trichoplax sp. H2]